MERNRNKDLTDFDRKGRTVSPISAPLYPGV
jgi:hypothetical protein